MDSVRHPTARRWSEMSPFIGCWSINPSLMPQPGTEYQYSSVTGTSPQLASALLLPSKTGNFRYLRASVPVLRRTLPATRRHVNVSTCSLLRRYGGFRFGTEHAQPKAIPAGLQAQRTRAGKGPHRIQQGSGVIRTCVLRSRSRPMGCWRRFCAAPTMPFLARP